MKRVFIKDIQKDVQVNDFFIVLKKAVFTGRNGTRYLTLRLRDCTGTIEGRIWDKVDELGSCFERNDLVYVESKSRLYQDLLQLSISDIRRATQELSIKEMKEFYPECAEGSENLRLELRGLIGEIANPHLAGLFGAFEKNRELVERFCCLPASVGVHHVTMGGLVEHSVAMAKMGRAVARWTGGDVDIITAGALLHDIGKTEEIGVKGGFSYSDRGRLLGHITLGIMILDNLITQVDDFPAWLADVLRHIIISHHGEMEWGSPKKPMCIEALVVHYLDNLDAKVTGVKEHMREGMEDERWTRYHKLYESRFYLIPEGDLWK